MYQLYCYLPSRKVILFINIHTYKVVTYSLRQALCLLSRIFIFYSIALQCGIPILKGVTVTNQFLLADQ